ncbi:hypothetical protein IFVP177_C260003 [Vibrio parahaemolyticus]
MNLDKLTLDISNLVNYSDEHQRMAFSV